jgi:hypothetical protein
MLVDESAARAVQSAEPTSAYLTVVWRLRGGRTGFLATLGESSARLVELATRGHRGILLPSELPKVESFGQGVKLPAPLGRHRYQRPDCGG